MHSDIKDSTKARLYNMKFGETSEIKYLKLLVQIVLVDGVVFFVWY
jgi:hypothetical protein